MKYTVCKLSGKNIGIDISTKVLNHLEHNQVFKTITRVLLSILITLILAAFAGGILKTFFDVLLLLNQPLEIALRKVIIDTLILLAVVEIYKTALTYFSEGRVRVTYIVDTVLVIMLSELISLWFAQGQTVKFIILIGILFSLIIIRILAISFHPSNRDKLDI